MSKRIDAVKKCAELPMNPSSLKAEFIRQLREAKREHSARGYDRLLAIIDEKKAGYPPIESVLEMVSDLHEPTLSEAFQEMVGKGYDYEAAATKMIETALFIIAINKLLNRSVLAGFSAGRIE